MRCSPDKQLLSISTATSQVYHGPTLLEPPYATMLLTVVTGVLGYGIRREIYALGTIARNGDMPPKCVNSTVIEHPVTADDAGRVLTRL